MDFSSLIKTNPPVLAVLTSGINRSTKMIHNKFKEFLQTYTMDEMHIEPLQKQLHYTRENLTEQSTSEKKDLELTIK